MDIKPSWSLPSTALLTRKKVFNLLINYNLFIYLFILLCELGRAGHSTVLGFPLEGEVQLEDSKRSLLVCSFNFPFVIAGDLLATLFSSQSDQTSESDQGRRKDIIQWIFLKTQTHSQHLVYCEHYHNSFLSTATGIFWFFFFLSQY